MKTKTSYLQKRKAEYEHNRSFILKNGRLTEPEYFEYFIETGCLFLEYSYYKHNMEWRKHYCTHAYSQMYWMWWELEWKQWEAEYLDFLKQVETPLEKEEWCSEMQQMISDAAIEDSYHNNYLSNIRKRYKI